MKKKTALFLFLSTILVLSFFLPAQSTNATIIGKVCDDATGKGIKNVLVTATNLTNGGTMTRETDKKGKFRFISVAPGAYSVTFELEGYASQVARCDINAEQTLSLKIKLKKKTEEDAD